MIYDITLGKNASSSEPWTLVKDGSMVYYENISIRERFKISKPEAVELPYAFGKLVPEYISNRIRKYKLPKNIRWVNNNVNLNPLLIPTSNFDDNETHILVISLMTKRYKMLSFKAHKRILQTFHTPELQGCIVVVTKKELEVDGLDCLSIDVYDNKRSKYGKIDINFAGAEANPIIVENHVDNGAMEYLKKRNEYSKTSLPFKLSLKRNHFITALYITTEEHADMVRENVKNIRNKIIFTVPDNFSLLSVEERKSYIDRLRVAISTSDIKSAIRAVTLVGVTLPISIIHDMKFLYVLSYEPEHHRTVCLKST